MKISNLLEKDFKLVEKKKIFFLVPVAIVLIAAIFMLIYGLVFGSPLNLGTDFTGGYSLDVRLGTKLTESNRSEYEKQVRSIIENLENENGTSYGIKVKAIQLQGSGDSSALQIMYEAVAEGVVMDSEINPKLQETLQSAIFKIIPAVTVDGSEVTLAYQFSFKDGQNTDSANRTFDSVKTRIEGIDGLQVSSVVCSEDYRSIIVTLGSAPANEMLDNIRNAATIDDKYSGLVSMGSATSAAFSSELLWSAFAAILASVVLMLVYIAFRFELTSGISAIIALFHDILIMFCFMVIFHIEINSTFIAALITILGYSINNTIIVFDRIRENKKTMLSGEGNAALIANKSVSETLLRSLNTTLTTLLTIGMVAILGVRDIKIFALPIIIGLLAGTYSSICISPAVWASWKDRKKRKGVQSESKEPTKAVAIK